MKEFFGFGGYQRTPEGYMSKEHLIFVISMLAVMAALAVILGVKNKNKTLSQKNDALIVSAFLIDGFELFKIVLLCFRSENAMNWIYNLPLFLCSLQLITIPVAAFTKGRTKNIALDFVFIFGLLGAVLGTIAAGNNYSSYPVLSFDNVVSAITHCISGFCCIYIGVSGMISMERKNVWIECLIFAFFCALAYIADILIPYNYMFMIRGDGTPYDLVYDLVNGNAVLYPILVAFSLIAYMLIFYAVAQMIRKTQKSKTAKNN
ncbi:MAG: YwaF family protein [Clostridia bacterium]|nr:YwaF family protein [Clostridia bacterium]